MTMTAPLLSPDQVGLVRAGWTSLRPLAADVADLFFRRLFERLPGTRYALGGATLPYARDRWVTMVSLVVDALDHLDEAEGGLQAACLDFRPTCLAEGEYDILGAVFISTITDALSHECDDEVRIAWARAFALVIERMRPYCSAPISPLPAA